MGYTTAQAKEFINHIAPIIVAEGRARGYRIFSTVIAQAIVEGAAGTSVLAKNYHNHFGMKCGSSWKGKSVNMSTKEEYSGLLVSIKDNFRVYDNDVECVKGYYDFVSTKRYANLKEANDYKTYANYLKQDGYATSSSYVNTLVSTVNKYELYKWDEGIVNVASTYIIGRNYVTVEDLYIRTAPNGTKCKHDNITLDAKKHAKYDDYGNAILKSGTTVTCKNVKALETSTWIQIPSGWICAKSKDKEYIR